MTKLEETIRDKIIEKLEDIEEIDDDLVYRLYETENCDAREAIQWIKENFEDLADYVEEYGVLENPFLNPKRFQVIMTILIARVIIDNAWKEDKEELIVNLREE